MSATLWIFVGRLYNSGMLGVSFVVSITAMLIADLTSENLGINF